MSEPLMYDPATDKPRILWGQCSQGKTNFHQSSELPPASRRFAPRPIPSLPSMSLFGSMRNQPCPCGRKQADGKTPVKFKKCCLGSREKVFQQAVVAQREARQRARYEAWQRDQADFARHIAAMPEFLQQTVATMIGRDLTEEEKERISRIRPLSIAPAVD